MTLKAVFAQTLVYALLALGRAQGTPVITDFTPTAGAAGDQVRLSGSGFLGGGFAIVFWNGSTGVVAQVVFINSDTLMTVSVPSGISNGPIGVQQGTSVSYTANDFIAIGAGPYISGFSPLYASVNDTVIVTGAHLGNPTGLLFSGTAASEFTANADGTQITTRVPAGATNGVITVITSNGTSNSSAPFTVVGPGPFITDFSPVSGDSGTKVTINGLHLSGITNVTFNGQPGAIVTATSPNSIQVAAPQGVTTGPIAVNTVLGSSVTSTNFYGKPGISGFAPSFGRSKTNVWITGANLLGATRVLFNGTQCDTFSVTNNTNLVATVPASTTTGFIRVIVPGGSAFSTSNFVIRPTLSSFSPTFGPVGTAVTISGANLTNANGSVPIVRFNGIQAPPPTNVTFSQMTAQVPVGASTGPISVTMVDGSDTNAALFYLPAAITSFTPTNSAPGTRITISGKNLLGASALSFNGTAATNLIVTNNLVMGADVPSNLITGPISVATPAGKAVSSGLFYGAPKITNFTPTHGLPGSSVRINGINFLGGSVQFNGLSASVSSLNNTQIVATVPAGASTGPITVIAPAGTNTSVGTFTLDYTSDLQVWMTNAPNPAILDSSLVYTITIVNAGPFPAPNATLTNILPATVTLLDTSISAPWVLSINGNVLTGSASSLNSGSATTFTITVVPQVAGTITDTITVSSDNQDPAPGNNTFTQTTLVVPVPLLSIDLLTNLVQISWPVAFSNYALQFQNAPTEGTNWSAVTSTPAISGNREVVTESTDSGTRFYRLRK